MLAVIGAWFTAQIPADDPMARSIVSDFGASTGSMTATSYLGSIVERLAFWVFGTVGQGVLMLVVPMMLLLAFWAGRRRILEHPGEHLPLLRRVAVVGIAIGWLGPLPAALDHVGAMGVPDHAAWVFLPVQIVTGFFGGLGYVALFGLIGHRVALRRTGAPSGNLFTHRRAVRRRRPGGGQAVADVLPAAVGAVRTDPGGLGPRSGPAPRLGDHAAVRRGRLGGHRAVRRLAGAYGAARAGRSGCCAGWSTAGRHSARRRFSKEPEPRCSPSPPPDNFHPFSSRSPP